MPRSLIFLTINSDRTKYDLSVLKLLVGFNISLSWRLLFEIYLDITSSCILSNYAWFDSDRVYLIWNSITVDPTVCIRYMILFYCGKSTNYLHAQVLRFRYFTVTKLMIAVAWTKCSYAINSRTTSKVIPTWTSFQSVVTRSTIQTIITLSTIKNIIS